MAEGPAFHLLSDIIQRLNLGNSLEEVFDLLYDRLHEFVPYNRIALAVTDENAEKLSILAVKSDGKLVLGRGYTGEIAGSSLEPLIREGKTRIIADLQDYLARKPDSESTLLIVKEGMRSSLTLPLVVQGRPTGVIFFSSREPRAYRPEHEEFLRGIVGHMAAAVEKSRLIDALREKTEYLENILHHSADGIIACDAQNRIRTWNEGARRIFGYEAAEVLGKDYSIFVRPGEGPAHDAAERNGFLKDYECVRMTKDGRRIVVQITSTVLRDKQGRPLGRSSMVRDVTHLKRLQQELVATQSLAAVGELAATVAHEIKNPLAGISGAIQVLQDAIPATDSRREVVAEILGQITRLDNTVRDLLTYARPSVPAKQEVDLKENLERSWSLLSQQPGASEVRFSVEGADGLRMSADPHLLQQVWINLFQNAVEAMPKGGDLRVAVADGPAVHVEVRDQGTGVAPGHASKVFRPFFSTKTRGTGLGLAITRKIVEAHRGTIRLESLPNQGTTVFVEIPR